MCVTRDVRGDEDEKRSEEEKETRGAEMSKKNKNPTQRMWGITLPEHPTCENLISISASKPCCVQNVLGTGGTAKPTGPRRGATMQSPHFVDTQVITSDLI